MWALALVRPEKGYDTYLYIMDQENVEPTLWLRADLLRALTLRSEDARRNQNPRQRGRASRNLSQNPRFGR
jgi:hypothetical protein